MEVNCEGCAGCCLDWRPLVDEDERASMDHERRGPHDPLDDQYNFVALTRDEVRAFVAAGLGDALTPRLWAATDADEVAANEMSNGERSDGEVSDGDETDGEEIDDGSGGEPAARVARIGGAVEVDGYQITAIGGRPVFFVGLRKPPKPVAPFGLEATRWLHSCVFLDPATLQCRIHGDALYPDECGAYPRHHLALARDTECERVEAAFGGDRLLSADVEADETAGLLFGPQAIGGKLFCHPDPSALEGVVARAAGSELTSEDRAAFVAVAAASSPGMATISEHHREQARAQLRATASWAGVASREWQRRRLDSDGTAPDGEVARTVEDALGAPETPGWDAVDLS